MGSWDHGTCVLVESITSHNTHSSRHSHCASDPLFPRSSSAFLPLFPRSSNPLFSRSSSALPIRSSPALPIRSSNPLFSRSSLDQSYFVAFHCAGQRLAAIDSEAYENVSKFRKQPPPGEVAGDKLIGRHIRVPQKEGRGVQRGRLLEGKVTMWNNQFKEHAISYIGGRVDLRVDMDMVDEWHLLPTKSEGATAGPVTVMDVSDGWNIKSSPLSVVPHPPHPPLLSPSALRLSGSLSLTPSPSVCHSSFLIPDDKPI